MQLWNCGGYKGTGSMLRTMTLKDILKMMTVDSTLEKKEKSMMKTVSLEVTAKKEQRTSHNDSCTVLLRQTLWMPLVCHCLRGMG